MSGKEELLRMALDRALDGWFESAERARGAGRARDRAAGVARPRRGGRARDPAAVRHPAGPGAGQHRVERAALGRRRSFDGLVADLVAEAERDGDVRADVDPKVTARLLSGMVNSLVEWYRPGGRTTGAALADAMCAVAFDGLRVRR